MKKIVFLACVFISALFVLSCGDGRCKSHEDCDDGEWCNWMGECSFGCLTNADCQKNFECTFAITGTGSGATCHAAKCNTYCFDGCCSPSDEYSCEKPHTGKCGYFANATCSFTCDWMKNEYCLYDSSGKGECK